MGKPGILAADPGTDLLGGAVVVREPTGSRHAGTVDRLAHLFISRLARRAVVRIQNPVTFPDEMSELQPDLTLLRPRPDFYVGAHPGALDVLLVIEVADSSLRLDRRVENPLYARAGVAAGWLVGLPPERLQTPPLPRRGAPRGPLVRR